MSFMDWLFGRSAPADDPRKTEEAAPSKPAGRREHVITHEARVEVVRGDAYIRAIDLLDLISKVRDGHGQFVLVHPADVTTPLADWIRGVSGQAQIRALVEENAARLARASDGAHAATDSGDESDEVDESEEEIDRELDEIEEEVLAARAANAERMRLDAERLLKACSESATAAIASAADASDRGGG